MRAWIQPLLIIFAVGWACGVGVVTALLIKQRSFTPEVVEVMMKLGGYLHQRLSGLKHQVLNRLRDRKRH